MKERPLIYALPDLRATEAFGSMIAGQLGPGDVVALSGELGVGKTTLARAILVGLGYKGEVPSPTFTIIETYEPPSVELPVIHADFYRLDRPEEIEEIGLDDYREGAALIAEWPEKAGGFSSEPGCLAITLEKVRSRRRAIVEPGADWLGRLP